MRERPILMSAPMVRALLTGTKCQTRRLVKVPPLLHSLSSDPKRYDFHSERLGWAGYVADMTRVTEWFRCPYGAPGDQLWVRETHARFSVGEGLDRPVPECVAYRATCDENSGFTYVNTRGEIMGLTITKWTPSIFMPRWASRITLAITSVRVERLQDISEEDARAEGVSCYESQDGLEQSAVEVYADLWRSINGAESWDANPFVWVVSFQRVPADVERAAREQMEPAP